MIHRRVNHAPRSRDNAEGFPDEYQDGLLDEGRARNQVFEVHVNEGEATTRNMTKEMSCCNLCFVFTITLTFGISLLN